MIESFETPRVVIAYGIASGNDFIFMVGFDRDSHFRVFPISGSEFSIEGSLGVGVEFVECLVFEVLAPVIKHSLTKIASARRVILAVQKQICGETGFRIYL